MPATIHVCHRCPYRAQHCAGPCPCTIDNRDISAHAKADYCPEKKYGSGEKPPGWDDVPQVASPSQPDKRPILRGMIGIAKAVLHIGHAPKSVIAKRRVTCRACPHATVRFGIIAACDLCDCFYQQKTKLAAEQCPDSPPRWKAVEVSASE